MKHTRNSTQATLLPKEPWRLETSCLTHWKKKRWEEVITSIDLTHNSRKAWQTIKKLSNDPTSPNPPCLVKSNQIAHHLLVNGQGTMPTKPKCPALPTVEGKPSLMSAFSEEEYRKRIAALKTNKTAGIDDILVEQLKNLGPKAHKWLHTMFNTCFIENKIPKIWRQSNIMAILKPGKDSAIPKNYRPISLLCHTYKLYERLILNRVSPLFEQHLIKEQAGFRPGKSCTSQLVNLTQHVEDGYQRGMITGAAFVDLSAAYDTVNHRILIQKPYNTTQDSVEPFRTCCPTEDYMWNWIMSVVDGKSRRMACPRGVSSHQSCWTFTLMTSQCTMERVTSYTQMIYLSQPSTLHSQK